MMEMEDSAEKEEIQELLQRLDKKKNKSKSVVATTKSRRQGKKKN